MGETDRCPARPFVPGVAIDANRHMDIDTLDHNADRDSYLTQPALNLIDWSGVAVVCRSSLAGTLMELSGSSTSPQTQAQAIWHDGYLT